MRNLIKISIETPCGEDFRQFTPSEQGGFCQSCKKEVIDFTSMSDRAVYNYFQQGEGNVCGRLRKDQMKVYQAILPVIPVNPLKTKWHLALAASLGLLALVQPNEAKSQVLPIAPKSPVVQVDIPIMDQVTNDSKNRTITISGRLTDENGDALVGANVIIQELRIGASTNLEGNYSFKVKTKYAGKAVTLMTAHLGFESVKEKIILGFDSRLLKNYRLKEVAWEGEMGLVVTSYSIQEPCKTSAISTTTLRMDDGILKQDDCSLPD